MKKDLKIYFSGFGLAVVFFLLWETGMQYYAITPQVLLVCVLYGSYHWGMHLLMEKGKGYKVAAVILEVIPIVLGILWLIFVATFHL